MSDDGSGVKKQKTEQSPGAGVFRSIAACQRCRVKKIKCDQNFPSCTKCLKAGIACVGFDPATGREVPRSYIFHLEQKIQSLEEQLKARGGDPKPENLANMASPDSHHSPSDKRTSIPVNSLLHNSRMEQIVVPRSGEQYMGASSGITFAKLIMAAVKMTDTSSSCQPDPSTSGAATNKHAVLPPKATAQDFIRIYFAQSNTQLPILHREEFLHTIFEPIYGTWDASPLSAHSHVAANRPPVSVENTWFHQYKQILTQKLSTEKGAEASALSEAIHAPEQFHRPLFYLNIVFAIASSINHLQYLNSISEQFRQAGVKYIAATQLSDDPLESLQTSLLMSVYAIMRPCYPGVWYILGRCLRMCVDLGLHNSLSERNGDFDAYTKDRRRRLFWSTYSLDRQICFYFGRPVGIPESSIKTTFPSLLDDAFIVHGDRSVDDYSTVSGPSPSYKMVSFSFFQVRQIQSEVQRILYEEEEIPRRFANLEQWRDHCHGRLEAWWTTTLNSRQTMDCDFNIEFLELNYNHTLLMLNGLSPRTFKLTKAAFSKVAAASQSLIVCYSKLYHKKAVNYTWAAVHNLFMAGSTFLYALFHSEDVRRQYPKQEVIRLTQDCITVLLSLVPSCDAAKSCAENFQMLAAAVLKLCYSDQNGVATPQPKSEPVLTTDSEKREGQDSTPAKSSLFGESVPPDSATPGYEWMQDKAPRNGDNFDVEKATPFYPETNLDDFFSEVANLSPVSSSFSSDNTTDFKLAVEDGVGDVHPARDGKRVFELMNQVPTESLWDQFFTRRTSNPKYDLESDL